MSEAAPESVSLPQPPLEGPSSAVVPALPQPPPQSDQQRGHFFFRTFLDWPRAIVHHPLRSLTVAALLLLIAAGTGITGVWLWASYHLRAGRVAVERYHTAEAVRHLQAAMSVWPRDPEILLLAARAARRAGSFDTADHFLDLCQEQRKDDEQLGLERICLRAERGEPDSVINYCRVLIEQNDPAAPLLYEALAQGYRRSYQLQTAHRVLDNWLEQGPDNPQAFCIQGQIFDLEMRHADAIRSYRAALRADPNLDAARLYLCDVLMQLGSTDEAQPHLEYLRNRLPDNPKVLVYLARIQDRQGQSEEARQTLEQVLSRHPHFAPALLDRGILALRAKQFRAAEKYLREAVRRDPSDYQAHDRLAFCLEQNDKPAEADKIREHMKQMEDDVKDLQAIIREARLERMPHDANLHYQIGMISLRAGAEPEALRWLHSALKEDPNHQGAHMALIDYYQRKGDLGRAREHQQKLIK